MSTPAQQDVDRLAHALARLLAVWWQTDFTTANAQGHLARLEETTADARAPPGDNFNCKSSCHKNAISKTAK
jgi:hypothetical protein